jgi:hypothetical protein
MNMQERSEIMQRLYRIRGELSELNLLALRVRSIRVSEVVSPCQSSVNDLLDEFLGKDCPTELKSLSMRGR